jgi:hypothetical protein
MEATERSISPTMTISSRGSAMMAISPMFRPVKKNVVLERKVLDRAAPNARTAISTSTSAASQRRNARQIGCRLVSTPV